MTKDNSGLDEILGLLRNEHQQISAPTSIERSLRAVVSANHRVSARRWLWAVAGAPLVVFLVWIAARFIATGSVPYRQSAAPIETAVRPHAAIRSDFIALPSAELLPPPRELRIWRIRIARGELAQYGFNVSPTTASELIYADFLVGEDGLPREIRLVR